MKKFFRFVGTAAVVAGVMVIGGIADRHSESFAGAVTKAEDAAKRVKGWMKNLIQPK